MYLVTLLALVAAITQGAIDRYLVAVEAHGRCDDQHVTWVASLDEREIKRLGSGIRLGNEGALDSWHSDTIASAVVMHTRIAASMWRDAPRGGTWRTHLEHASRLATLIARQRKRHEWLPAWYSVAASHLVAAGEAGRLTSLLDEVPRELRQHPLLRLARAGYYELLASGRVSPAALNKLGGVSSVYDPAVVSEWLQEFQEEAAGLYGELSATAGPFTAEARIRLAHLLVELGRFDEAAGVLGNVALEVDGAAELAYFDSLVRGRVSEIRADYASAEAAYRAAARRFPSASTPAIALAHLYYTSGFGTAARREAAGLLARLGPAESVEDPWVVFSWAQYWRTPELLRDMLSRVSACAP